MAESNSENRSAPRTRNGGPSAVGGLAATPQKSLPSPSRLPGILNSALKFLPQWIGGTTDNGLPQGHNEPQHDEESEAHESSGEEDYVMADGDEEPSHESDGPTAIVKHNARPTSHMEIQIPAGRRGKRKQPVQESEPDASDAASEVPPAKKLRKRPRVVAKQPIASGRQTRAQSSRVRSGNPIVSEQSPPPPSRNLRGNRAQPKPIQASTTTNSKKRSRPEKTRKGKEIQREEDEPASVLQAHTLLHPDNQTGDEGLYETQSPVKDQPLRTKGKIQRRKSRNRPVRSDVPQEIDVDTSAAIDDEVDTPRVDEQTGKKDADVAGDVNVEGVEGNAEEDEEDEGEEEDEEDGEDGEDEAAQNARHLSFDTLIDLNYLEEMLILANRVGHAYNDGEETLFLKKDDRTSRTTEARRLEEALRTLENTYKSLPQVPNSVQTTPAEPRVDEYVEAVIAQVRVLIDTRFRSKTSTDPKGYDTPKRTKDVLADVYFVIIPKYLNLVVSMARWKTLRKSTETNSLEQFKQIVQTFSVLVHDACDFPPDYQPKVADLKGEYGSKTFAIQQPARRLRPKIRHIEKILQFELHERVKLIEGVKRREQWLAKEQRQLEREHQQALEHRQRIEEARRRIKEAVKTNPLYDDPIFGPQLRRADQEDREMRHMLRFSQYSQGRSGEISYELQDDHVDQEQEFSAPDSSGEDPQDVFGAEERVRGVFPSNNKHDGSRSWTRAESDVFMDIMRENAGKDRYSKVAEVLQRSMEDIFAFAREAQGAFDEAHERGLLNDRGDAWTHDVWIEPGAPGEN